MKGSTFVIAGSIIIAGVLIAGAIIARPTGGTVADGDHGGAVPTPETTIDELGLRPISDADHIRGISNPKVAIIEYSDFECPFCAQIHPTLARIVEESGDEVAWVYRHFPLSSIHPNATPAAIASECVAELGGDEAFWQFADEAFLNQRDLGTAALERYATNAGVDAAAYRSCIADDSVRREVLADGSEAQRAGGRGTPFAVVVTEDGDAIPFSGALPYETVRELIDELL